jgi:hypothetical protein
MSYDSIPFDSNPDTTEFLKFVSKKRKNNKTNRTKLYKLCPSDDMFNRLQEDNCDEDLRLVALQWALDMFLNTGYVTPLTKRLIISRIEEL